MVWIWQSGIVRGGKSRQNGSSVFYFYHGFIYLHLCSPDNQLSRQELFQISCNTAVALVDSAYLLVPFIFAIIVPFKIIKDNFLFIFLALS